MKTKKELIDNFIMSCNRFWDVDVNIPIFEGISRIDGIKEWDRNKMDVGGIKDVCIRVFKENNNHYIMDLIINSNSKYEINENEFINLQKEYFREYL